MVQVLDIFHSDKVMDNNFYNDHRHVCDDVHNHNENDDTYYNVYDYDVFLDSYFSHLPRIKLFSLLKGDKDINLFKKYFFKVLFVIKDFFRVRYILTCHFIMHKSSFIIF